MNADSASTDPQVDRPRGSDAAVAQEPGALGHLSSHLRLWGLAIFGLVLDLWSKHAAFAQLTPHDPDAPSLIPGVVRLELSLNPGALFGMGSGWVSLFIVASVAALCFVLYMFAGSRRRQWTVHVALGMILAGALGNLYDRAFIRYDLAHVQIEEGGPTRTWIGHLLGSRDAPVIEVRDWGNDGRLRNFRQEDLAGPVERVGVVRDFLKFEPIAGWDFWPWVFNVADICLVIGVAMLLLGHLVESVRLPRHHDTSGAGGS